MSRLSSTDKVGKSWRPSGIWQIPRVTIFSAGTEVISSSEIR